jgi:hypothetical protein
LSFEVHLSAYPHEMWSKHCEQESRAYLRGINDADVLKRVAPMKIVQELMGLSVQAVIFQLK